MRALSTSWLYKRLAEYPHWLEIFVELREVKVYVEYKVYDFNGILGSVGGSLGLFIGFSFLDMLMYLMRKGRNWGRHAGWFCNKKKRTEGCPM